MASPVVGFPSDRQLRPSLMPSLSLVTSRREARLRRKRKRVPVAPARGPRLSPSVAPGFGGAHLSVGVREAQVWKEVCYGFTLRDFPGEGTL